MRTLSIGSALRLALIGLTIALAAFTTLAVGALFDTRQRYEDDLARSYELQVAASELLAASVIEEAAIRAQGPGGPVIRETARLAFDDRLAVTRRLASRDGQSRQLVRERAAVQRRVRRLQAAAGGRATDRLESAILSARSLGSDLQARQRARRSEARRRASEDTRRYVVAAAAAGFLGLVSVAAFISLLLSSIQQPLADLVATTRRLARGRLEDRVEPAGPTELRELGGSFNDMAGALADAQKQVEAERGKLAVTIASLGDALIVTDSDYVVTAANPRATELVPELSPGRKLGGDGPLSPAVEAVGREVLVESRGRTLAVTVERLDSPGGGTVWTIRDTSERARLERMKSEFVATASHELRSPLTSIKGFAELLSTSDSLGDRQREFVDVILLSANRLVDLVNDLLDVARIEAGQMEVHRRACDLAEVAREVATLMGPRIADKQQSLELSLDEDAPPAHADPVRMRQIIVNLLTNAHLYTGEGGRLTLALRAEGPRVHMSVSDTGRGMRPTEVEHVFDRFVRVGDEGGRGIPGSGLGLSIVKSLVELQDGTITVASAPGEGSTFSLRLPAAEPAGDRPLPRLALRGRRVLIVDDEPDIASLIAVQLRPLEVTTEIVHSGERAMELLGDQDFDAVTLDVSMPGMTGHDVLEAIRGDPRLRSLAVVIVSAFSGPETPEGEIVVMKPIDAEALADALGTALLAASEPAPRIAIASPAERDSQ